MKRVIDFYGTDQRHKQKVKACKDSSAPKKKGRPKKSEAAEKVKFLESYAPKILADKAAALEEYRLSAKIIHKWKEEFVMEYDWKLSNLRAKKDQLEKSLKIASKGRKQEKVKAEIKKNDRAIKEAEKQEFSLEDLLKKWIKSDYAKQYKSVTFLLKMACLVPASTAIVESSWSVMNLISDAHSSHLTQEHLNVLMHVALHRQPLTDDDIENIYQKWRKMKARRVFSGPRDDSDDEIVLDDEQEDSPSEEASTSGTNVAFNPTQEENDSHAAVEVASNQNEEENDSSHVIEENSSEDEGDSDTDGSESCNEVEVNFEDDDSEGVESVEDESEESNTD